MDTESIQSSNNQELKKEEIAIDRELVADDSDE